MAGHAAEVGQGELADEESERNPMTANERAAAKLELEALKADIRACTPPSQCAYVFGAIFPLIHQRIIKLADGNQASTQSSGDHRGSAAQK